MIRKAFKAGVIAVAVWLGVVALSSAPAPLYALVGWGLTGYLIWRAYPGVRADLHRLNGLLPGSSGTHGGRSLARARSGDL